MTLKDLEIGKSAVITSVGGKGALRQHFLDMGMIPGAEVTVVKFAPMGDPMELQVHGYELTLRLAEAEQIEIEQIPKRSRSHAGIEAVSDLAHPGLGEDGKYHSREDEHPLPEGTTLTSILGAMEPLTAVVIGVFVFKELFTLNSVIGILLILLAVGMVVFRKQKS